MNKLDLKKINKIYKKNSVKSEKTQEKLKINSRILAKNSKGGSLRLLNITPKTLKKEPAIITVLFKEPYKWYEMNLKANEWRMGSTYDVVGTK